MARNARWISGRIKNSDYPDAAEEVEGTVLFRFTVGTEGRVTDCKVTKSSGHAILDRATCNLIIRRLRYSPARDWSGRPSAVVLPGEQEWFTRRLASRPPIEEDDVDFRDDE
jgi:protein TonB